MEHLYVSAMGGLGAAIIAMLIAALRWLWELKRTISVLQDGYATRSAQMQALYRVQLSQIKAQRTLLEVIVKHEINGNVEKAFDALSQAEREIHDHGAAAWR